MIAEELINQIIPTLHPTDEIEKALYWMDELHVLELPVIDHEEYQGLILKDNITAAINIQEKSISELPLIASQVFALPHHHFYDVLKLAEENNIQTVAIVNEDKKYLGVITIYDTLATFAQKTAIQDAGGTLVLVMPERDYSLSKISNLIEAEEVKILSSYVSIDTYEAENIKLTLKLNKPDLSRVIATLERFDYRIVAKYHQSENSDTDKERFDLLMRYLSF